MPINLSLEDQFCLLLARAQFSAQAAKESAGRLAPANWDMLFERARAHGLIPLVYHRLQGLDFPGVPAQVRRKLIDAFGVNAFRNEMLAEELVRVLARLGEANTPVIPLKGAALAESLYGDVALRTCADMDILIHPEDLKESLRILGSLGYKHAFAMPPSIRLQARYGRDCALIRGDERWVYPLQVHCGLIWGGPMERPLRAEIWGRASARRYRGAPALALNPTVQFLYLAVHAARHGLSSFKWIVDLDWLVNRGGMDWSEVREKSRKLGWEKAVGFSVAACASFLQTPIPAPLGEICAAAGEKIRRSEAGPLEILHQSIFVIRILPTFAQKAKFIASRIFIPTSQDSEFLQLPSSFFYLYFLLRPCRLAITTMKWLVQATAAKLRRGSQPSANR
jgi:hypothetical protein